MLSVWCLKCEIVQCRSFVLVTMRLTTSLRWRREGDEAEERKAREAIRQRLMSIIEGEMQEREDFKAVPFVLSEGNGRSAQFRTGHLCTDPTPSTRLTDWASSHQHPLSPLRHHITHRREGVVQPTKHRTRGESERENSSHLLFIHLMVDARLSLQLHCVLSSFSHACLTFSERYELTPPLHPNH
jgi:hypothetical protein